MVNPASIIEAISGFFKLCLEGFKFAVGFFAGKSYEKGKSTEKQNRELKKDLDIANDTPKRGSDLIDGL